MDFGSFENTIDKNIETDKASDKFDQQLQAYKDAGNSLTLAKSGVEMATASMHEGKRIRDAAFFLIIMLFTFAATLLKSQKYVSSRTIQKCVEHVSTST